jgi:integrase
MGESDPIRPQSLASSLSGLRAYGPTGARAYGRMRVRAHGALEAADLPRIRFHDLRHSCATLLLVQGVWPRVVMDILGHSEIAMTMDTYSHVIPELQREAAERMESLFRRAPQKETDASPDR